jgi:hypothetical protein
VEERRFTFLGMIVACFLNKFIVPLNGEQAGRQLEGGDKANIGVTSIVPATVIQKILDSLPAQQERAARTLILRGVIRQ